MNWSFTNPATDPYSNNDGNAMRFQNQTTIDTVIGDANYDIGHVFSTGGGGIASLGVVGLSGFKARGVTGLPSPVGDPFYVDFVAHEIGHQFGGNHTFNGNSGNCTGETRNAATAYEPGSGSTIQAYAGICGNDNLQPNSDPYFHSASYDEIVNYTTTGVGNAAATITQTGNNIPTVSAGLDYTIPARTPFALTATGSDADAEDVLTYNWEQRDLGPQQDVNAGDNGSSPLFRSFTATTNPTRTFQRLSDLLNNTTVIGETLPTTNRTMNFRVTVRDNRSGGGGVNFDESTVTVVDTGAPFQVTGLDTPVTWSGGSTETITWDVAGTSGSGINAANVNILLSTDGGMTFSTVLASATANDGSHVITVPDIDSSSARVKVEAADNVFFDISNTNFTIEANGSTGGETYTVVLAAGQVVENIDFGNQQISTPTALDNYVNTVDPSYGYSFDSTITGAGYTAHVLDMTSQTWMDSTIVDFPEWQHWVTVIVPDGVTSNTAVLYVDGGSRQGTAPATVDVEALQMALDSGLIVIHLPNVPSQPLTFLADGVSRVEDEIIAYTFNEFLNGGDDQWPLLLPMVKSAVAAMNTAQDYDDSQAFQIDDFIVTGESKRGWTTWLTAAVDNRVKAIAPFVIDVLNIDEQMVHHRMNYEGVTDFITDGYSAAIEDYVNLNVVQRIEDPLAQPLLEIVDPYEYRDRLTVPKYLVNATGDEFFVPDSGQFYLDDLQGPTYVRYVPNVGHNVNSSGLALPGAINFFAAVEEGSTLPTYDWTVEADGTRIRVNTLEMPVEVRMWQATNLTSLEFRQGLGPAWTSSVLTDQGGGEYVAEVVPPSTGGTGFFIEMTYNVDGRTLVFTTEVSIAKAPVSATIAGRHLFYNNSRFDDPGLVGDVAANTHDDGALATDKTALTVGELATVNNYSAYSRGINGIMVDIANSTGAISLDDFQFRVGNTADISSWKQAPAPTGMQIRAGGGTDGADRITITWPDNVIQNQWLKVKVLANENTGLKSPDVHFWGNQIGDTGNSGSTTVNFDDVLLVLNNPSGFATVPVTSPFDINRDGRVNFDDTLLVLNNPSGFSSLMLFAPQEEVPPPPAASAASVSQNASMETRDIEASSDQPASEAPAPVTEVLQVRPARVAAQVDIQPVSDETASDPPQADPDTEAPAVRPVPAASANVVNVVNGPRFSLRGLQASPPVTPPASVPPSTDDSTEKSDRGESRSIPHVPVVPPEDEERSRVFGGFFGFGGLFRR